MGKNMNGLFSYCCLSLLKLPVTCSLCANENFPLWRHKKRLHKENKIEETQ